MQRLHNKVAILPLRMRSVMHDMPVRPPRLGAQHPVSFIQSEAQAHLGANPIGQFAEVPARAVGGQTTQPEDICFLAQANVADPQESRDMVKRVVERWGRLDILVNNAGITRDKSIRKMSDEEWLEVIQTNLNA